jgi:N-sulfoglucosamine sulfohydrolase
MLTRLLVWLLVLVVLPLGAAPAQAAGKNVVLVVADDLGLDLGCYGHVDVKTPHLDSLAAAGTLFTHAFCTTASCSASRSVILTGLHNHANGQYGHQHAYHNFHTHATLKSLPLLLSQAGYRTCLIGKLHVQPEEVYRFDQTIAGVNSHSPVEMAEHCRELFRAADSRPYFLYFCPTDPHRAGRGFANERSYPGVTPVKYDPAQLSVPHFLPDYPQTRQELAGYYQAVSRLDQGVGRLIEVLKETGRWEDTLVLFLSDNGSPFPGAKTTLYEPGMRLPLIVRAPGQASRGQKNSALVSWVDIVPTILEFAGAKGPNYPLHGRSFLSVLEQAAPAGWDEVHASHTFHEITMYYPMRAIRTRRHKLILNVAHPLPFPFASDLYASLTWQAARTHPDALYGSRPCQSYIQRPQYELYDLQADPKESRNLAGDPNHASLLRELQAKLRAWQEKTKDPWVVKYEYE